MDKKKILIVCWAFYPQNTPRAYRATELAKEFARQGYEVTVLIPDLSDEQVDFAYQHRFTIKNLGRTKWMTPNFGKSRIGYLLTRAAVRFLQLAFEYPAIELMFKVNKTLKKESGYHLMISIAVPYPIHWGVALARNSKHAIAQTWVADCGDPYMGCDTDSFKKWFHFSYVEKWFMRKADFVTIPVESARAAYYAEFHSKINIIPQGFKLKETPVEITYQHNRITSFAYAGGFIPNIRDPRPFLDVLSDIHSPFRFIIYTNSPQLLNGYKEKLKDKLEVRSYIPRKELLTILAGMDFLVNFDNNTDKAVPSKLIDYAIVARPVLNIEKVPDRGAIIDFFNGNYSRAMQLDNIDQYRIENVCAQFLSLIKK